MFLEKNPRLRIAQWTKPFEKYKIEEECTCYYVWYLQKISLFFFRNEGPFLHGFFKFLTHYCVIERQYIRHCISFLILYKFQALYFCIPKKLENNSSHYYSTYTFLSIWRSKTLFKIYDFLANFQCVSRERETSQKSIFSNLLLTQNDKIIWAAGFFAGRIRLKVVPIGFLYYKLLFVTINHNSL